MSKRNPPLPNVISRNVSAYEKISDFLLSSLPMTVNTMFSTMYIMTIILNPMRKYYGKKGDLSTKKNIFTEKIQLKRDKKDIFVIHHFLDTIKSNRLLYLGCVILQRKKYRKNVCINFIFYFWIFNKKDYDIFNSFVLA